MNLNEISKEYLYEQLEAVEDERNKLIYLLNEALDVCCPNHCVECLWKDYCNNRIY